MIEETMATYLQRSGFGTMGTDIFIGQIPEGTNGLFVERSGGQINNYVPIEETVVDIYSKDIKAETAINRLERIKKHIHRMYSSVIDDDYIYIFLVLGDIEPLERDVEYEKLYKLSVQVFHRDTTLIS